MKYYACSEKGLREHNEDAYLTEKIDDCYFFGIADGMGGHVGGEFASSIAIDQIKDLIKSKKQDGLIEGIKKANSTIVYENEKRNSNMGTTIVACSVNEKTGECTIIHIGDPDTYFATRYSDVESYGTKEEHIEALELRLQRSPKLNLQVAHFAAQPEPHRLDNLDRMPKLKFYCCVRNSFLNNA